MKKIKLTRYRNIKLTRREAGEILTVGPDVTQGHAETLVRIGGAEWIKEKKSPQTKAIKAPENKA